jgi:hypothetical protein
MLGDAATPAPSAGSARLRLFAAGALAWLERRLEPPRLDALTVVGYGLLAALVLVTVWLFAAFVASAVLGIDLPSIA